MTRRQILGLVILLMAASALLTASRNERVFWSQWGRNPRHSGMVNVAAQPLDRKLADIVYDEFAEPEKAENVPLFGEPVLTAHYQSTLIDEDSFYMVKKSGASYPSCSPPGNWIFGADCGPNAWDWLEWNVVRYHRQAGQPRALWTFHTDWKPEPNATNFNLGFGGLVGWEPVFHPALANGYLYVPGSGGTIWKVDRLDGKAVSHIQPLGTSVSAADTFVSSPLTADDRGNIYYNVIQLNINGNPWNQNDVVNAWLVKVTPHDISSTVTYATLVPDAPAGTSTSCPAIASCWASGRRSSPCSPRGSRSRWPSPRPRCASTCRRCGSSGRRTAANRSRSKASTTASRCPRSTGRPARSVATPR